MERPSLRFEKPELRFEKPGLRFEKHLRDAVALTPPPSISEPKSLLLLTTGFFFNTTAGTLLGSPNFRKECLPTLSDRRVPRPVCV